MTALKVVLTTDRNWYVSWGNARSYSKLGSEKRLNKQAYSPAYVEGFFDIRIIAGAGR